MIGTPALSVLKMQVDTFRKTNAFTPGDPGCFSIPILRGSIELPGKIDPRAYMTAINASDLTGKNVAVMFSGNGGLCVEALNQGAVDVWAVEPRNNYGPALKAISGFISQVKGRSFSSVTNLNEFVGFAGKFDLVIWPEGLEQLKNPITALEDAWKLVAPGGKFVIEVTHGDHKIPTATINRWTPKEDIFAPLLAKLVENAPIKVMKGRLQRRVIYEATRPLPVALPVPAPVVVAPAPAPIAEVVTPVVETPATDAGFFQPQREGVEQAKVDVLSEPKAQAPEVQQDPPKEPVVDKKQNQKKKKG